jgi:hypothetical protein
MIIGRIPTSDPNKIESYISKVIDYENGSISPEDFAKEIHYVSDASSQFETFRTNSNALASLSSLQTINFSSKQLDRTQGTDTDLKTNIISSFDDSPLIINYLGHGAEDRWAATSVFSNSDVDALNNSKLPIVVTLNCLNGSFADPNPNAIGLGEKVILNENAGAIAFIGSTAMTTPPAQMKWAQTFYNELGAELGQGYHNVRLGDLFNRSKIALGDDTYTKDVVNSFIYLGDPTLKLPEKSFSPRPTNIIAANPVATPTPAPAKSGGLFSCGANASDGTSEGLWQQVIDLLSLILGIAFISLLKMPFKRKS